MGKLFAAMQGGSVHSSLGGSEIRDLRFIMGYRDNCLSTNQRKIKLAHHSP
jgi:hypothetical protein